MIKIKKMNENKDEFLYTDESTRRVNGLLHKMKSLFDNKFLTTWEYVEFMKLVRIYAEENDLILKEDKPMIYKFRDEDDD